MKGIILAGGKGTRLYPSTYVSCKQLLPIYDKPMIFYPISVLMISGIREILIITNPEDKSMFRKLLGNGSRYGCVFKYSTQKTPNGIGEAFNIGEEFINKSDVSLILGDNFFYGSGLGKLLRSKTQVNGASIFGINVPNPREYGVIEIDDQGLPISIDEKPENPKSSYAIPGLYYYNNDVVKVSKLIKPSSRGEKEITDINRVYLEMGKLEINILPRGITWLDAGTPSNIYNASEFVKVIEKRTGRKIACLEEIAFLMGYVGKTEIIKSINKFSNSEYSDYLRKVVLNKY